MKFLKNLFRTRYRIVHRIEDDYYVVQEHCWWDLIYGWWWFVGNAHSLEGAKEIIEKEKAKRKIAVVYED